MRKISGDIKFINKARRALVKDLNHATPMRKTNTYCHLLWDRAFINEYGDVFFCCLCKPGSIGNIYEHDLAYIWQESEKAKSFRRMSLSGSLSCHSNCNALSKKEKELGLGRFYRNRGKLTEAEAAFKDVLKISPKNDDIYAELGWLYKDLGKPDAAEAAFKKALELEPRNAYAYAGLGWLYKDLGKPDAAEASFKKALELNPNTESACLGLGWLYKDLGKPDAAEAAFKKALELESGNSNNYVALGWLYKDQKKYSQAGRLFERALKLNPRSYAAYAELGWLYRDLGKPSDAEASFKKALEINPNTESACLGLGWLYKDQGSLIDAKQLLSKAIELNPRNEVTQTVFSQLDNKQDRLGGAGRGGVTQELFFEKKLDTISRNNNSVSDLHGTDGRHYPSTLQILVGTFCPLNCIMCSQDHRLGVALNNDMLKRNIDWSMIDDIIIQGGEVLAIESVRQIYIWLTEKMQKRLKLFTNGLLIDREWAERLVRNSEWIEVSLNAATKQTHELVNRGSDFDKVIRNIKMLIDLKRKFSAKIEIRYHFTILPENLHEVAQAIKFADELGCDLIAYSFYSPNTENFLLHHNKIKEKIRDDIFNLTKGPLNIKILRNQLEQLGFVKSFDPNLIIDNY